MHNLGKGLFDQDKVNGSGQAVGQMGTPAQQLIIEKVSGDQ
jgi:hypothetical protein